MRLAVTIAGNIATNSYAVRIDAVNSDENIDKLFCGEFEEIIQNRTLESLILSELDTEMFLKKMHDAYLGLCGEKSLDTKEIK